MSKARSRVRARSVVGLYREATIGSLPIEEVRADLGRLGIDPATSIRFAKRLSDGRADNPAAALLKKLERSDAGEAEIADLEQAPIEAIRAALPEEAVQPTPIAPAARADNEGLLADDGTTRTGLSDWLSLLQKRRRVLIGGGASIAGIAACVLLFFAVGPTLLGGGKPAPTAPSGAAIELAADDAEIGAGTGAGPTELAEQEAALAAVADAVRRRSGEEPGSLSSVPLAPQSASPPSETLTNSIRQTENALNAGRSGGAFATAPAETAKASPPSGNAGGAASSQQFGLPETLTGIFVLDVLRLPAGLIALELEMRDDRLAERVDEAGLQAAGRNLLALIAFERDGERVEAALVEEDPALSGGAGGAQGSMGYGFELLELP